MKNILKICFLFLCFSLPIVAQIPTNIAVQIVRAEDERRYDKTLEDLMKSPNEKIRVRAALAAGRIGDERAISALTNLLEKDSDAVRQMAAFALGEIESIKAADAILKLMQNEKTAPEVRARAIEAAGKIAAANSKDTKAVELGDAILDVLDAEARKPKADRLTVLLGLTATLRVRPEEGDFVAAKFLTNFDARIRADAANTLSRLRSKNYNDSLRTMLLADEDAIARANAARALGAAEDKDAFSLLLEAAATDEDSRVRVSAIRSLGNLKDKRAADKLLERGETLLADYKKSKSGNPIEKNELLEIATTLGRILPNSDSEKALNFLNEFNSLDEYQSPETEIAIARITPKSYYQMQLNKKNEIKNTWQNASATFQASTEISAFFNSDENKAIKEILAKDLRRTFSKLKEVNAESKNLINAFPDILRFYTQLKTADLPIILREHLNHKDLFVRATVAELIGEQPATKENIEALRTAFAQSLSTDKDANDAQLAILSALVKLDKSQAASSLKFALDAPDYLVRRHAANLIRENDLTKDFPNAEKQVGTVKPYDAKTGTKLGQILNTQADYVRAVSRKNARAIITTEKGTFTIEFFPEDAPLTVDNFIKLARANYFNGLAIHRVVPNFVMQDGDPRGDGNGGPGWQIRCELNMREYERGAVGMALSGKDTGGSQWFVTHSPQSHLDGGYTVFGRVNETDMKVVDTLVRGDKILTVKIVEGNTPPKNIKSSKK